MLKLNLFILFVFLPIRGEDEEIVFLLNISIDLNE